MSEFSMKDKKREKGKSQTENDKNDHRKRNQFKDDEFIFFQRSQRNCEPEKRSLAGA